jgi:low affinity Fe/Cu permease
VNKEVPETLSAFQRLADWTSAAMGRPANIAIWLIGVVAWTAVFALGGPHIAGGTWLPAWFTSQGFNFPLNLVTTVAELFIGFLVAAAANRSERNLEMTLHAIGLQEMQIEDVESKLSDELSANTALTEQVHAQTALIDEIYRQMAALTKHFELGAADSETPSGA